MPYQRGDIVELPFLIPGKNRTEVHPAVIISKEAVYQNDGIYICVMITHSDLNEDFSFDLRDEMFISQQNIPIDKAKAHLIAYVLENHIVSNSNKKRNRTKSIYVDRLVYFLSDSVLLED